MSDSTPDTIAAHYARARELALAEVERLARIVLQENPTLVEFMIVASDYCFIEAESCEARWPKASYTANILDELLTRWNSELKLTGEPMRFTATGPVVREW